MKDISSISDVNNVNLDRIKHDILLHRSIRETIDGKKIQFFEKIKNNKFNLDRTLTKRGIIKGKERFYDSHRKKLVSRDSSGYVRAYEIWNFKRKYNPKPVTGWFGKKDEGCKFRIVSVKNKLGDKSYYYECNREGTEYLMYVPLTTVTNWSPEITDKQKCITNKLSPKVKRNNIRKYYKEYGLTVNVLARMFNLSKERVYKIVKDINPKSFSKVKNRCSLPIK